MLLSGKAKMLKNVVLAPIALLLTGCAVAAVRDSSQQYQQSLAAYKTCLGANGANPKACEGQRLAMEADERAFNNRSAALQGSNRTSNIIVQER